MQVIQRRGDYGDNREDFYRDWNDYKHGFGSPIGEFWLGNDQIHELTKSGDMRLRVELEAHDGRTAWAEYDTFRKVSRICFFSKNTVFKFQKYAESRPRTRVTAYTLADTLELLVTAWLCLAGACSMV